MVREALVNDRMPVILSPADEAVWLDPQASASTLQELLRPYPELLMEAYPVSPLVNRPADDLPQVLDPV